MRKQYYTQAHIDKATKWRQWIISQGNPELTEVTDKIYAKAMDIIEVLQGDSPIINKAARNRLLKTANMIFKEVDSDLKKITRIEGMKKLIAENSAK